MKWNQLTNLAQLEELINTSANQPVVIFKHSTRCSISSAALDRLERKWDNALPSEIQAWYLDLITYRSISNAIAERLDVEHHSPQVLLIFGGKCIYHTSHFDISAPALAAHLPVVS